MSLDEILVGVKVGVELCLILHMRPHYHCFRINTLDFLFALLVVLFWVVETVVIILCGGSVNEGSLVLP